MRQYDTYIFDLDGTLLYTLDDLTASVNHAMRTEGMKEGYGLNETNIIFRKHKKTSDIMDAWWDMINKYSSRDQTSLSYVLWKNNIRVNKISIDNARIDCLNYKIYSHN